MSGRSKERNTAMHKGLKRLSVATAIGMYLVLMAGSLVTNTGSGEGCGASWPLCHGRWMPPVLLVTTLIELNHRLVTGVVGILVFAQAIWAWRVLRAFAAVRVLAVASIALLLWQSWLGAAAVMWGASSAVLASHFGFSLLSFASVVLLSVTVWWHHGGTLRRPADGVPARLRAWIWGLSAYTIVVVYSGAFVRHTGSELACLGFPTCNGAWLPPLEGAVAIHLVHRLGAGGLVVLTAWFAYLAWQQRREQPAICAAAMAAFGLVLLQATAGALAVLTHMHVTLLMLHSTIVPVYFGVLAYLSLLAYSDAVPTAVRAR